MEDLQAQWALHRHEPSATDLKLQLRLLLFPFLLPLQYTLIQFRLSGIPYSMFGPQRD